MLGDRGLGVGVLVGRAAARHEQQPSERDRDRPSRASGGMMARSR